MSKTTLGLPYPWKLQRHLIRGDRFYFFAFSPATLAFGFEFLRDGFVVFLGCFNVGWASISSFERREREAASTSPIVRKAVGK
jgi:hypothetical protein